MPALALDSISDQFAYRPTGSTTAAFVALTHTVAQKLETCTYARCLLIDYIKAFDMINHSNFKKIDVYLYLWRYNVGCSILSHDADKQFCLQVNSRSDFLLHTVLFRAPGYDSRLFGLFCNLKSLSEYNSIFICQ